MKIKRFMALALILLLTGCKDVTLQVNNAYDPPRITRAPIEGKWTIIKTIFTPENRLDDFSYKKYIGNDLIISSKAVIIDKAVIHKPSFQIRRVNSNLLLEREFNTTKESMGIKGDYLYIIDIYENENKCFEVYREKDDLAYININGIFMQIKKTSDQVTDKDIENFS